MRIISKGKLLYTEHIWFEKFITKDEINSTASRVCVYASPTKLSKNSKLQHSIISDLKDITPESLLNTFSSTVRNEVRRAEREGIICKVFSSTELSVNPEMIIAFAEMYHEMYAEKGLDRSLDINNVKSYINNNAFILSVAYFNDKPCVFHSYVTEGVNSRLLHSCSEFRVQDNAMRNSIGRANKLLHYKDMLCLNGLGVTMYDWGGISSIENPNGIDKFKMSFGGVPIDYYNCTINLSLKAKLASIYSRIFNR